MNHFQMSHQWTSAQTAEPDEQHTMCRFMLAVGKNTLTQNEDIFSQTVSDSVLVSALPLAQWFAASWWRLLSEPLPRKNSRPPPGFRMAHEIAAAGAGYVWPQVLFATDREVMQIWAVPSRQSEQQSVRYLNGLATPAAVSMSEFESRVDNFINSVIARLDAKGSCHNGLQSLWQEVLDERNDVEASIARRCEAELGYDPDECPEDVLITALNLKKRMGDSTLSELAPVFGKDMGGDSIGKLKDLIDSPGLIGRPDVPAINCDKSLSAAPWERAVTDARSLRSQLGIDSDKIETHTLCDLLGIRFKDVEDFVLPGVSVAAVGKPVDETKIEFIPRRRHPNGRRFELARFVGDYLKCSERGPGWLASTDLSTSRQKYQRAFAAEFLCPINSLQAFLEDDFSDDAIEDAVEHFGISPDTVRSLLANNNLLYRDYGRTTLPYALS
ncbi:ImmA/IrrE family metallo-endopeptidase [Massilia sp. H6]|uniref:ImmA/IrrE family metallo-endopeptidase n=1 Tax=Massilia sp. H6 TaxID=2970464 RepID=UPI0021683EE6|nr:hypothetical protein [Massilia sp. H6]UVW30714.1 hypothetical protein NRS07_19960 [Massilia sp. H6]